MSAGDFAQVKVFTVVKRGLSTTIEYTKELLRTPWSLQENFRTPSLAQRSHVIMDRADCPWSSTFTLRAMTTLKGMLYFEFNETGEITRRLLKSEVSSSDINKSVAIGIIPRPNCFRAPESSFLLLKAW